MLVYSAGSFHMDFDMIGTLWVCSVHNLHNHTWLPYHGSQSSLLKISAMSQINFFLSPVALGFGF